MEKSHPSKQSAHFAGSEDVRRLYRHIDDHTVAAILALKPTIAELEEAAARASGAGDMFAALGPEHGVVARILDLTSELDELEEPGGQ
ncbi:MAG: hypothetical protein ACLPWS_11965 [Rhodomicrobium sp.]